MIIDTHVHIGEIMNFHMPFENVLYSMKKYNIDFSIVSNCYCAECDHSQNPIPEEYRKNQIDGTVEVLDYAKKYPTKIGVAPWCCVKTESPNDEFVKLIEDNIEYIYALKFHPFHSVVNFDDPKTQSYLKVASQFDLPVVIHTGGSDHSAPNRIYNMAKMFPEINFVMVHMGLGTDNKEAIDTIAKLPNLYGDTTWVSMESSLELIRKCGSEKLIFGSDNPIDGKDTYLHNKTGDVSLYQHYFNELSRIIPRNDYENIMHKNAERIFRIKVTK